MKTIRHENRLWVLADDHLKALDFAREAAKAVEREECAKIVDAAGEEYSWRAAQPDEIRDIDLTVGRIAPMVCLNVAAKIRRIG